MTEFSVGDRVLVPGEVTAGLRDGVNVRFPNGQTLNFHVSTLLPDSGGRDLTAQDVQAAALEWFGEDDDSTDRFGFIADYLNRIARVATGPRAGDTAPAADSRHFMLPGTHEWPRTPTCNCGAVWRRDVDQCSHSGVRPGG